MGKAKKKVSKGLKGDGFFDFIPGGVGDILNSLGNAGFDLGKQAAPAIINGLIAKKMGGAIRKVRKQKGKGALGNMLGSLFPF